MKIYTEKMYRSRAGDGPRWTTIIVVYTQPKKDRMRHVVYAAWTEFLYKSRIESLQDWWWDKRTPATEEMDEVFTRPGVVHDLNLYDLSKNNRTKLGEIEVNIDM